MEASIRTIIGICNGLLLGWLSLTVILLAAACGIVSAVYWARASMIQPDTMGGHNSGDPLMQLSAWMAAVLRQSTEAAHLNAVAARWAAAAALLGGLSALLEDGHMFALMMARL